VSDCWARIQTVGTGALLNVGVSGTPSGLLQLATADVTGYKYPFEPVELSACTATFSKGTLLIASITNAVRIKVLFSAATAIVFQNQTATTLAAGTGWIFIEYENRS
jgi:hypothetical protein